jgi:hypothetical protein
MAVTEKGEAFLTDYCSETAAAMLAKEMGQPFTGELEPEDDYVVGSASLLPHEYDHFKRLAAAAAIRVQDRRRERHR